MRESNRRRAVCLLTLMLALALGIACSKSDNNEQGRVTIAYREVQCLENPWQQAWLSAHPGQRYPSDDAADRDVFIAYWREAGIGLMNVRRERYLQPGAVVCQACTCPTGYDHVAESSAKDADLAEARGWLRR